MEEEEKEREEKQLEEWIEKKNRKKRKEWLEKKSEGEEEGVRKKREEGIIGSSTEGHVSFVLAERMSSRPMGWSIGNVEQMSKLRAYAKNGGNMLSLIRKQRKPKEEKIEKEAKEILSSSKVIQSEKKSKSEIGKWIEAIQAKRSPTIKMQYYFQEHIWGL